MPIPVLVYVVGGALAVVGAAAVIAWKWRQIVGFFAGKPIAVLGMRAVGKSTLVTLLATGEIEENYKQTKIQVDHSSGSSGRAGLHIKSGGDVGGDISLRSNWKAAWTRAANEGGYVFYLIDGSKIQNGNTEQLNRISLDASAMAGWVEERRAANGSIPKLVILATHADKLAGWNPKDSKLQDEFVKLEVLHELQGLDSYCGTVLGSLRSRDEAVEFLYDVVGALGGVPREAR